MNMMGNGNKVLSIEEFEQKLRQQKDPMKISLTNPIVNFENPGMGPMSPLSPMTMNANMDQMKKKKELYLATHGLKSKSSNSSLNGNSNNIYRMNSDQTLLQSPRMGSNPGMGNNLSNLDLAVSNKYLNNNGSDLTIGMDNGSYEFNPNVMHNKIMMNPSFNNSQSSFNSFGNGGFRDESFDDDSDLEDLFDGPPKRKQTETEALADFLKNTGPDMLGGPVTGNLDSPNGKKKRGSLFKFKKGKKKEKKPSTLSEEIGSGSSSPSSHNNTPKHTPIVINYPGSENQPNLNSNASSQQNNANNAGPGFPPNPNVPPMPAGFNNIKPNGSISSINSYQQQNNTNPYIMNLKAKPDMPENPIPDGPRFNNFNNPMQQQLQTQNVSMGQKGPVDNFPYNNKMGMANMAMNLGGNSGNNSEITSPTLGPQDPRKLNKMRGMNGQDPNLANYRNPQRGNNPAVNPSVNMNYPPNKNMMNNLSISTINNAKNFIENATANDAEISPSIKNRIVENLENLTIERNSYDEEEDEPRPRINATPTTMNNNPGMNDNPMMPNKTIVEVEDIRQHPQISATMSNSEEDPSSYYDQGLLDDDDDDDYFSESDSELIRNTRFNANMVGDEFYYDKSFDSPIVRPPPDPNRKTVQFNDEVKRISHTEYGSDQDQELNGSEEDKAQQRRNARKEHRLTGSHGLRGPPPLRDHDRDRDRDRDHHRIKTSERRSSRHGPPQQLRPNLARVLNNQKQTVNNRVNLPPPQMGEITVTNSGFEDLDVEDYEEDDNPPRVDSGNDNANNAQDPIAPPPPVPFDKNAIKNLENNRTSTPPPANFGKLAINSSSNKSRHHISQPPTANGSNGQAQVRVRPKVRHVQIQTRRINSHNMAVQTTSYIEDINTIFKGDIEKSTNVEVLQNELVNYREIIKRMNDELRDIKRENQQLTSDYRQMRHEREKMIENNKRKEIEFDDLSSRAHKKLKELIEDRQQLLDEKEKLENENEQMENIINKLKKQIESIES